MIEAAALPDAMLLQQVQPSGSRPGWQCSAGCSARAKVPGFHRATEAGHYNRDLLWSDIVCLRLSAWGALMDHGG